MTGPQRASGGPLISGILAVHGVAEYLPGCLDSILGQPAQRPRKMPVWSRVFRRAFLPGLSVSTPQGIHEDVPVSATALLKAHRLALLDQVCSLYRRRPGSFLATASMGHFDIFASYARVFAAVAGTPADGGAGAAVRAALFGRMVEHCSSIPASGLGPRSAAREFFGRRAARFRT